jgi:hypothetical protein
MHSTSRLVLAQVDGSDEVSAFPTSFNDDMDTLDDAVIYYPPGTLVLRPAATAVAAGTFYKATDTGLIYHSDGTAWTTVMLAGGWVALTLKTGFTTGSGSTTAAARMVGDTVLFRSATVTNATGSGIAGSGGGYEFATLPAGITAPADNTRFLSAAYTSGGVPAGIVNVTVQTSGAVNVESSVTIPNAATFWLIADSYTLT